MKKAHPEHHMARLVQPRPLSPEEHELLMALAEVPGKPALSPILRCQVQHALVEEECSAKCGNLNLSVDRLGCPAIVEGSMHLTAQSPDIDGALLELLLHARDGYVYALETYRYDGAEPKGLPPATSLVVLGA